MTMNLTWENHKSTPHVPAALKSSVTLEKQTAVNGINKIELTRDTAFLDGTHDIFDVLARHPKEGDALARTLGSTIALLKRSSQMLQNAENTIDAQNKRLENFKEICPVDEASGLLNRRGFFRTFTQEVARTARSEREGGLLVMFNLENISRIRKKHGEEAVNMAVKLIAQALESEIRTCDHAGRVLDDEFVLLLTDTEMDQALIRLQNMALRLNKLSLIWDGQEINLNLSLGLKSFGANDRADEIFQAACEDLKRNRQGLAQRNK